MDEPALRQLWEKTLGPTVDLGLVDPRTTCKAALAQSPTVDVPGGAGPERDTPGAAAAPAPDASLAQGYDVVGGYDLVGELARGGMGVVFRARQRSLGREVAVKKVLEGASAEDTRSRRERFLAEARVTAGLDHPNIVPVHDLVRGEEGETLLAMKLVGGTSWKALLHPASDDERRRAASHDRRAHLGILLAVANAVAFAHARGVVHRDLKPENVMVGEFGEVLLMDWGLALALAAPRDRGSLGGTPAYMAPELALARTEDVGPWTDVYLLGAVLHEVLTGRAPHARPSLLAALRSASESVPPTFAPDVPEELAQICRRALAKAPGDRHPSALAFRAALEAYLEHEGSLAISAAAEATLARAVGAKPGTPREPLSAGSLYADLAEAVAGFRQARVLWPGNEAARSGEARARAAHAEAALETGDLGLAAAQASALDEASEARRSLLERIARSRSERERAARGARLQGRLLRVAAVALVATLGAASVIVSGEARRAERERRRAEAGRLEAELQRAWALEDAATDPETVAVAAAAVWSRATTLGRELEGVDPDLARVAAASRASAGLLAVAAATDPLALPVAELGHEDSYHALAWSPDGRELLLGGARRLALYSLASGQAVRTFEDAGFPVGSCAFSPAGDLVAAGSADGLVRLWEPASGRLVAAFAGHRGGVATLQFSPDGRRLASAGADGALLVRDRATGAVLGAPELGVARGAAFSPDGTRLAVAVGSRATLLEGGRTVWSVALGGEPGGATAVSFETAARGVAFAPDGREVLVGPDRDSPDDRFGALLLLDAATGQRRRLERVPEPFREPATGWIQTADPSSALAFSPDGRFVTASDEAHVWLWERASGRFARLLAHLRRCVLATAFSPDGKSLAIASTSGRVEVRSVETGALERSLGHDPGATALAYSPDGSRILTGDGAGTLAVLDRRTRAVLARAATGGGEIRALAVSPDGATVAVGTDGGAVSLRDARTGEPRRELAGHEGPVAALAFSGDGALVLSAGGETLALSRTATGELVRRLEAGTGITGAALSPDGRTVLAATGSTPLLAFDLSPDPAAPAPVARALAPSGWACAFAAGADRVLVGTDHTTELRDARTGALEWTLPGSGMDRVQVSRDGALVLAQRYGVRVLQLATGRLVREIEAPGDTSCALAPDGEEVAVAHAPRLASGDGWAHVRRTGLPVAERTAGRSWFEAVAPEGIAAVSSGDDVFVLDERAGTRARIALPDGTGSGGAEVVSPDRRTLFVGSERGVDAYSVATGALVWRADLGGNAAAAALDAAGRVLGAAVLPRRFVRLDAATGRLLAETDWPGTRSPWTSVALAPDARTLAVSDDDDRVRVFSFDAPPRTLDAGPGHVERVAISADGRRLGAALREQRVKVWELATGRFERTLEPCDVGVSGFAFSPTGDLVAVSPYQKLTPPGRLLVWDVHSGHRVRVLEPPLLESWSSLRFFGPDRLAARTRDVSENERRELVLGLDLPPAASLFPGFEEDPVGAAQRAVARRRRTGSLAAPVLADLPAFEAPR